MAELPIITRIITIFLIALMTGWIGACASTDPERQVDSGYGMDQAIPVPDSIPSSVIASGTLPDTNEPEAAVSASSSQDFSEPGISSHTSPVRDIPAGALNLPEDTVKIRADTVITPPIEIARPVFNNLRLEVSVRLRRLYVISDEEVVASYPVAVGRPEWPTRTGRWGIYEVVWNPWWHPPDQEWAWGYPIMAPGDPDNPLGRAQLIYDAPRSIHGTINPSSIGKAVSHGSIRVANEVAMDLVRKVMEYSGIERDDVWFREIHGNRNRNVRFRLEQPVPIWVY